MSNPLLTCPGVQERASHLVHLSLRDDPLVLTYQFWGASTVNDAFGDPGNSGVSGAGPDVLFTVPRGGVFRSPSLRRSGRGQVHGSTRGTTHVAFNVDDYLVSGGLIPPDDQWLFVRVQESRTGMGLLALAGVPEATITLAGVLAGDRITIKGVVFDFAAGANNLAGKAGTVGDPFLVGLGASDSDAAANLTAALNDNGDVSPVMDLLPLINTHTFATNPGAPSAVARVQPEDAGAVLVPGNAAQFAITTSTAVRVALDADATAEGQLVWAVDPATPVLGPIYGVPPASHFGSRNPSFTLQGTAPSSTACVAGAVPDLSDDLSSAAPRAMHMVFPGRLSELSIQNISLVNLLVSFDVGQAMQTIVAGGQVSLTSGDSDTRAVLLACPDGIAGAAFTLHAVAATEMSDG